MSKFTLYKSFLNIFDLKSQKKMRLNNFIKYLVRKINMLSFIFLHHKQDHEQY